MILIIIILIFITLTVIKALHLMSLSNVSSNTKSRDKVSSVFRETLFFCSSVLVLAGAELEMAHNVHTGGLYDDTAFTKILINIHEV